MLLLEDKIQLIIPILENHIYSKFGADIDYGDCPEAIEIEDDAARTLHSRVCVSYGVSKMVVIIPECSKVLKVPFNGKWEHYYPNSNSDEYEEEFIPFMYANGIDNEGGSNFDYCYDEYFKYKRAKEFGVDMFFAATEVYGGLKNGHPLYLQERVIPYNDDCRDLKASEASVKLAKEKSSSGTWNSLPTSWCALAVDHYGEELVDKFFSFIKEVEPEIAQDMHGGNYGYRENGEPVILDFSGWRD